MASNNITERRKLITEYISQSRLRDALRELRIMVSGLHWSLQEEVDKIEEAYRMMLQYAVEGVDDPQRKEVYDNIVSQIYGIIDRVVRERYKTDSPTLYFNTLRYEELQSNDTLPSLIAAYGKLQDENSLLRLVTNPSAAQNDTTAKRREIETLERRIFNRLWVAYPLNSDQCEMIRATFSSDSLPSHFKECMVSALLLGLLAYYDERRLTLLLDLYASSTETIAVKALCAALMAMYVHRSRLYSGNLLRHIEAIKDSNPAWHEDVRMVFMQFIRARDTERITRKMRDEVIPSMLKLRPDIYKKINDSTSVIDLSDIEENPEWQELLDKSGITDKMKELSQLQEDGGDVFMSTFSHLKHYPFFTEIANWFLPFDMEHSSLSSIFTGDVAAYGQMIEASPFLCNSDKYSIALSLGSIPAQQRTFMMSQFNAQMTQAAEMRNAELLAEKKTRESIANKYVQDVYRFFKLFRRKGEFDDPFDTTLNMLQVTVLQQDLDDEDTLTLVAEFYFKRGYYNDALDLFKMLAEKNTPTAQLYQKMGYCRQQEGDIGEALQYYRKSELLNGQSLWTLRRIASCYKLQGKPSRALEYFKRVEEKKPDDLSVALNIGHCLMELGQYDDALKYYFKVEFLDEKSTRAWRPIAWCSFLSGNFDQSHQYYEKIMSESPTSEDYLNMGHLALATGHNREAVDMYKSSISHGNGGTEAFLKAVNADKPYLTSAGVDPSLLPLIIDAVLFELNQ